MKTNALILKKRSRSQKGISAPMDGNLFSVAILTNKDIVTAALTFSVGEIGQSNNHRVQLLPDGKFKSKDGRPADVESGHWLMDEQAFTSLKANAENRENDFHFDYEHQTMLSGENGKPAIASGWFKNVGLEYVPGEGLFATNVNWTPKAAKHIENKEYRYVSAVFSYDRKTGRPVSFLHAALTNNPALDGMKAIAALKLDSTISPINQTNQSNQNKQDGEKTMNEAFKRLLASIGIVVDDATFGDPVALKAAEDKAIVALKALNEKADKSGQLETELNVAQASVVALKASPVDLSLYVPVATYNAQGAQLASLKAGTDENTVEQLLKDNAAKILGAADRDYLEMLGKTNGAAALKAALEPRVAIAALKGTQTDGKDKPEGNADNKTLTDEQLAVCKATGCDPKDFLTTLNA